MSYALYFTIWCAAIALGGGAAVMFWEVGKVAAGLRCVRCGGGWACWYVSAAITKGAPLVMQYCRRCRPRRSARLGAPVAGVEE